MAVSNSIWGEKEEVRNFLAISVDAEILVLGKDDYGNTVLSMVAAERHPQMVTLLPDHGARINSRNQKGRTPLMEAALWGRAEIVSILLARGADREMKDRKGRKAIDLARQIQENAEERHRRAGGVYKEDTFDADMQRKAVARMLGSQAVISTLTFDLSVPENSNYKYHSFHQSSMTSEIILSAPVATFPVSSLVENGRTT